MDDRLVVPLDFMLKLRQDFLIQKSRRHFDKYRRQTIPLLCLDLVQYMRWTTLLLCLDYAWILKSTPGIPERPLICTQGIGLGYRKDARDNSEKYPQFAYGAE